MELRRGIAVALAEAGLFRDLYSLLWAMPALFPAAQRELTRCIGTGDPAGACAVLMRRRSFRRKAAWAVFWSMTEAAIGITDPGLAATHEPELNGAFMTLIAGSLRSFPATAGSNASIVIGDHATLGNEARTGADFGLVLEIEDNGRIRHLVTLLQAKRARARRTDVRRAAGGATQLELLAASGIGSFLFYHGHGDPTGLGPTTRDARGIGVKEASSVDVLSRVDDLAARLAAGVDCLFSEGPPKSLPGMGAAGGREDALRMLFNPDAPGLRVNDVVVARVGAQGLSPRSIADFEGEWRELVADHRAAVDRAQGIMHGRGDEKEPPVVRI